LKCLMLLTIDNPTSILTLSYYQSTELL
jgi:hypothetical protein